MKKYLYAILALPMLMMWGCKAEEGSEPGTDPYPAVTLFTYTPTNATLNPDNDVTVRFATNSKTREVYYLVKPTKDVDEALKGGEQQVISEIVQNGQKLSFNGAGYVDVDVTGIVGPNYILAVASDGANGKTFSKIAFTGLEWEVVTQGTLYYAQSFLASQGAACTLEQCVQQPTLYRLHNAFGQESNLKLELLSKGGTDADGPYKLLRIPEASTPFTVTFNDGTISDVWVEDIGYWQNSAGFVTDESGYHNVMYMNSHYCVLNIAWMTVNGCVSYGAWNSATSEFIPD